MAVVLHFMDPEEDAPLVLRLRMEVIKQLWLAIPMMGVNLVQCAIQLVSVMFVGHLGELNLSSASIATSFCKVTGYSLLMGLASALETLCGQAYGAKQYHLIGIYMQRAILVLTVVAMPVAVVWYNLQHVLLFFGQAPDISYQAGIYARALLPGLFAYAFLQPLTRFLQTQNIVFPMFICSAATLVIHTLSCWLLVYKLGMGNSGAALSLSLSNWLNFGMLLVIVVVTPRCRRCWSGFSWEAFNDIVVFLKLAIPAAFMVCLEWWSFEAMVLLSGVLENPQLEASVFSILLNLNSLYYMFPWGIGTAASTRVSNELGAGRPLAARFSFFVSIALALVDGLVISTVLLLFRNVLGMAFSKDKKVISYVARMVPLLAAASITDALQGVISGVARGCGWQAVGALANFVAYYVVGVPLGYLLAFSVGLRGEGLLIGILSGECTQAIILIVISSLTNWKKQAENASKRLDMFIVEPLFQ